MSNHEEDGSEAVAPATKRHRNMKQNNRSCPGWILLWLPLLLLFVVAGCHRTRSIASATRVGEGDVSLYVMKYHGDYGSIDLQTGRGLKGVWKWLYDKKKPEFVRGRQTDARQVAMANGGQEPSNGLHSCTCFSAVTKDSQRLFGRNHDWPTQAALMLFTDPTDGYASVSMVDISWLGFDSGRPGLLDRIALLATPYMPQDGMNECGLTVGAMSVPHGEGSQDPDKETVGTLWLIREILDHASSVEEAIAIAENHNIDYSDGFPIHIQVSDTNGNAAVIEYIAGRMCVTEKKHPWQVCTNFVVSGRTEKESREACWRYERADTHLEQTRGVLTETSALRLLDRVSEHDTAWSVVYAQSSGSVRIVAGQDYDQVCEFQLGMKHNPDSETITRPILSTKAAWPIPSRGAGVGPHRKTTLKWTAGQGARSHQVYFGTERETLAHLGTVTHPRYSRLPELLPNTTYYWRIDEVQADGSIIKGDVWHFSKGMKVLSLSFDGHARDQSGQAHHGALHGQPSWVQGTSNQAIALNGREDYATIPPLDLNSRTMSITLWVRTEEITTNPGLVFSRAGSTCGGLWLGGNNDLRYTWNGTRATWSWDSGLIVPLQTWTFVGMVLERDQVALYLHNGTEMKSVIRKHRHGQEEFDGITYIGHDPRWGTVRGAIDEVRIFNYSLDREEVEALYLETGGKL